jgi:hypothetical protein
MREQARSGALLLAQTLLVVDPVLVQGLHAAVIEYRILVNEVTAPATCHPIGMHSQLLQRDSAVVEGFEKIRHWRLAIGKFTKGLDVFGAA